MAYEENLRMLCCVLTILPATMGLFGPPHIYPEGFLIVPYGESVELYCDGSGPAENLTFIDGRTGDIYMNSEKVNDTTIKMKEMLPKGVYSFYCMNTTSRKRMASKILVDEPPKAVTDFNCKSYNLDELKCSWTHSNGFTVVNDTLSMMIHGHPAGDCKPGRNRNNMTCLWTTTTVPRYRPFERTLHFTLKYNNVFGGNEQSFTIDHYSIVQPAPVNYLTATVVGPYNAVLKWNIPYNMVDILPRGVEHRIEYQIGGIDNTSFFRSVDTSALPLKNFTYRLPLDLPYAHRQYTVKMSIRPVEATGEEYWSAPSVVTFESEGKSTSEVNRLLYQHWRKSAVRPGAAFQGKVWSMRGERRLQRVWQPRAPGPLPLVSLLFLGHTTV